MMTPRQVADLTEKLSGITIAVLTVRRACQAGRIPGAKLITVGSVSAWDIPDEAGRKWASEFVKWKGSFVRRCEALARKGKGFGTCGTILDSRGQCANASGHVD